MPARQPEASGGVCSSPVEDDEDVGAGALAQPARRCWRTAPRSAPCSRARASATTFSPYEVVFRPASAPRSLRVQGTVTTAVASGRALGLAERDDQRGPCVAAVGAERGDAAGVGDPQPAERRRVGVEHRLAGRARTSSRSGSGRPEAAGRARPAGRRWRVSAKARPSAALTVSKTPSPTVSPWSKTDTVAPSASRSAPSSQMRRPSRAMPSRQLRRVRPDATASSRAALSSVSVPFALRVGAPGDARAGAEAQHGPSRPSRSIQKVRMPTASSPVPRSASTQPTAPQYGPRGAVSSSSMIRSALDLGAPVTEPGREGRGEQLGPAGVRRAARRGRWRPGGPARGAARPRTARARSPSRWRRPGRGRCGPGRRSSRSRRGPCPAGPPAVRPVPLIGPDSTVRAVAAQEELGRGGGDLDAVRGQPDVPAYGAGLPRAEQRAPSASTSARPGRAAARTAPGRGWPGRPRPRRCAAGSRVRRRS